MISEPILVFDGDCGFCTACVKWGFRNFRVMPKAEAFQLADLAPLGLNKAQCASAVYLVTPAGNHRGHRAVAELLKLQPGVLWRTLGKLMLVPGLSALAGLGYALVVRFRHLLPGASEQCRLDPKGM